MSHRRSLQGEVAVQCSLKQQQDGDYFLTTLLIKPLAVNQAKSETARVEFLVKQKKTFTFRHWDEEIGGDLCISHSLLLGEREYTLVMNADAMGKSIQGAGGSLVLGAVFEAIIMRTRNRPVWKNYSPEEWLRNCLEELQKIFISFDGNMMMSLVIGLLEDATGLFHYINAEHPWPVLYREGKASFLEESFTCRKLGMPIEPDEGRVFVFQLQERDMVLLGSDGKDDIVLADPRGGEVSINEDETLFLDFVEKNQGDPHLIYKSIADSAEIKDDLSILRLSYKTVEAEVQTLPASGDSALREISGLSLDDALSIIRSNLNQRRYSQAEVQLNELTRTHGESPDVVKQWIKYYTLMRNHDKIVEACETYVRLRPEETRYLYLSALSLRKMGRYDEALKIGEELRNLDPSMIDNLINLSHTYLLLGRADEAERLGEEALQKDPENFYAQRLRKYFEKGKAPT